MLTANEIRNVTFNKSMGGYKAAEVDTFLDQCADTVAELTNAKAELDKKLEVLADKLVEYRNDEDNIRTALLSAQRLGDTVVREAKHKAGLILEDAKIKADKIHETARRSIQDEENEYERIRKEITSFKSRMLSIYREHLSLIDVLPEFHEEEQETDVKPEKTVDTAASEQTNEVEQPEQDAQPAFEPIEEQASDTKQDVEPEVRDVVMDIPVLQDEESVPMSTDSQSESTDVQESSTANRFKNLKFGEDYDISKDNDTPSGFFKRRK